MSSDGNIPRGLCQCGCGERTGISIKTATTRGLVRGEPYRYVKGHQSRRPIVERFWEKVEKTDTCWLWTAAISGPGYGTLGGGSSSQRCLAHRFCYELLVGPIPDGMQIDHLCMNKRCVNPDHLEPVTSRENTLRWAATITHCPSEHPYTPENTYVDPDGARRCRECERARKRNRPSRRKVA